MLDSGVRPRLGSANALARPELPIPMSKLAFRAAPRPETTRRTTCPVGRAAPQSKQFACAGLPAECFVRDQPTRARKMHCFACQSKMDAGDRWCAKCGAAAQQSMDPDSERKFVTILRADLVQSTDLIAELEPEQAVSRLEPALTAMRAAVRQFGGIVSKELGDGLTAVFGAPMADDNHAPMACHAAIELVRRVTSLGDPGLQVRVGLHSGFVVAYVVASEFSRVYEIGGAAQHLAARLEGAAECRSDLRIRGLPETGRGTCSIRLSGSQAAAGFPRAGAGLFRDRRG